MITADSDLVEALDGLFSTPPDDVWSAATEMGLPWIGIDEQVGGSGGTLADFAAVAVAVGRYALTAPIVETHLAGTLLAGCGQTLTTDQLAFILGDPRDEVQVQGRTVRGTFHVVPWAQGAARLVGTVDVDGTLEVFVAEQADVQITPGEDLAGQPLDIVQVTAARLLGPVADGVVPRLRHAFARAAQLSGAIERASILTQEYTSVREQFGRPVGTFQAVVQHLVTLEQAAVASRVVARQSAHLISSHGDRASTFELGASLLVIDHHAGLALAAAHQAHGAIGMTLEYPLARTSQLIHTWRGLTATHHVSAEHLGRDAIGHVARLVAREVR